MMVIEDLNTIPSFSKPCALAIGNFDGVHLGHQRILHHMRSLVGPTGTLAILTFSNHPTYILPGKMPVKLITSKSLKLKCLSKFGADVTYCLEFNSEIAQMRYDDFIQLIRKSCPFDYLIFGEGDAFGYKREGTEEKMKPLAAQLGFKVEYLPKVKTTGDAISSGRIRSLIQSGDLQTVTKLLGHPFELEIENGHLSPHLCVPPNGNYPVSVEPSQTKTIAHIENGKISLDFPMRNEKFSVLFE
jgi:riboflavin kinase/FMN adenylyltransferase